MARIIEVAGLQPDEAVIGRLVAYLEELSVWNRRINLTGIRDMGDLVVKYVGDTVPIASLVPDHARTCLDIGTGAGAPGLVLKMLVPRLDVTLVDSIRKRVSFLAHVIATLGLSGVRVEQGRIGEPGVPDSVPEGGFDIITSQAVGSIGDLAGMSLPLLSPDGIVIAPKGPRGGRELDEAGQILERAGLAGETIKYRQPVTGLPRVIVILRRTPSR